MSKSWLRNKRGHKGTFGTVLVIGGADQQLSMLGGPVLSALAAYRSGAGKVVLALPPTLIHSALELIPEAIAFDYNDEEILDREANAATSIVVGPGWGRGDTQRYILKRILSLHSPTIIDADALNLLDDAAEIHSKCILTPHPGEFRRLAEVFKIDIPRELALRSSAIVVYKDAKTVITDGENMFEHDVPNSNLAIAGSGDVLSGILGALCAQFQQRQSMFDIAIKGVKIHAEAGLSIKAGALAHELANNISIE